ncbi:MAG: hypothetical protein JJU11_03545 [Candidatus Sumerlaeia bacterium]|nr:hypothetical protein [Candidatus Sumerlaeia bacterium]
MITDDFETVAKPLVNRAEAFIEDVRSDLAGIWTELTPVPIRLPHDGIKDWDSAAAVKEWNPDLLMRIIRSRAALFGIVPLSDPTRPLYIGQTTSGYGRILEHLYRITPQWRTKALQVHSSAYRRNDLGLSILTLPEKVSSIVLLMEKEAINQLQPPWNANDREGLDHEYLQERLRFYGEELAQLEAEKQARGKDFELKVRATRSDRIKTLKDLIDYLKLRSAMG